MKNYDLTQSGAEVQELLNQVPVNRKEIERLKQLYAGLSKTNVEIVASLPSVGVANTIYRVTGSDGYADYMFDADDLSTAVLLATYGNGIDEEPVAGSENLVKSGGVAEKLSELAEVVELNASGYWLKKTIKEYSNSAISFCSLKKITLPHGVKSVILDYEGANVFNPRIWFYTEASESAPIGAAANRINGTEIEIPEGAQYYSIYANAISEGKVELAVYDLVNKQVLNDEIANIRLKNSSYDKEISFLNDISSSSDFIEIEEYSIENRYVRPNGFLFEDESYISRVYVINELNRDYIIETPIKDNKYVCVWAAYFDDTLVDYGKTSDVSSKQYAELHDKVFNKLFVSCHVDNDAVSVKYKNNIEKQVWKNQNVISSLDANVNGGNALKKLVPSSIKNGYYIRRGDGLIGTVDGDFAVCEYNIEHLEGILNVASTVTDNMYIKAYSILNSSGTVIISGETTDISSGGTVELTKDLNASLLYIQAKTTNVNTIATLEYEDIGLKNRVYQIENILESKTQYGYSAKIDSIEIGSIELGSEYSCGNKILSLTTDIVSGFNGLTFGLGKSAYAGAYVKIDTTNIQFISRTSTENIVLDKAHGLNISEFLSVFIDIDRVNNIKLVMYDGVKTFSSELTRVLASGYGNLFIDTKSKLANICVCASSKNYNSKVWFIGDSYISTISDSRWGYHLINTFGINQMILGFPGSSAYTMYRIFSSQLKYTKPKYAVWTVGMNDPDSETNINADWKNYTDMFIELCFQNGIVPILQLIPNVGGGSVDDSNLEGIRLHNLKNEYIKTLGYRYIDIPTLVQSDEYGSWRSGWLSSDKTHPSSISAPIIAKYIIENVPECVDD